MNEFEVLEVAIGDWAEARGIVPNSTPMAQAIKTLEEVQELLSALHRGNEEEVVDAYSDIMVTLIIGSKLFGVSLLDCMQEGYNTIKDRTGYLREDGVFIKDT